MVIFITLTGCEITEESPFVDLDPDGEEPPIVSVDCDVAPSVMVSEKIPVTHIAVPYASYQYADRDNAAELYCRDVLTDNLMIETSKLRTQQIIVYFDAVYPIQDIRVLTEFADWPESDVEISLDDQRYRTIGTLADINRDGLQEVYASSVRLIFKTADPIAIQSIDITAQDGYRIARDDAWSSSFLRYDGWTGADGIFSFNLTGPDAINHPNDLTALIFSDTFIGGVNPQTFSRIQPTIINNSVGYYDPSLPFSEAFTFDYDLPALFLPDAFLYPKPSQLLTNEGLVPTTPLGRVDETLTAYWLSEDLQSELIFTFPEDSPLDEMYIWNFIDAAYQVNALDIVYSNSEVESVLLGSYPIADLNEDRTVSTRIAINQPVTELRVKITSIEDASQFGLSKVLFESAGVQLTPTVSGAFIEAPLNATDASSRLWLQDGIRIDDTLYVFPLLVKDELDFFKVHQVGLMSIPIVNHVLEYDQAITVPAPLQVYTQDGGEIYYGAGVMDHRAIDGYIYIYGYKDLNGRHLVVARTTDDSFTDFTQWEYFDGSTYGPSIHTSAPLVSRVSAELSVSYIPSLKAEEPYVVFAMLDTTSGTIGYATGASPEGPFGDWTEIYRVPEPRQYSNAYTYNAKLHLHLSTPHELLVSYNVNSTNLAGLMNAQLYYPRFITMTKIQSGDE